MQPLQASNNSPLEGSGGRRIGSPHGRKNGAALLRALRQPQVVSSFSPIELSVLLAEARHSNVAGRLAYKLSAAGVLPLLSEPVSGRVEADRLTAERFTRVMRWEVECLRRVFAPTGIRIVLLKGAAYLLSDLPVSRGRIATDVDILVAESELETVERTLLENGWLHLKDRTYDQRYYREYMHELPPFIHRERRTVLDVHHNILPRTSRLPVDAGRLLEGTDAIGDTGLWRLSDEDMILHAAVHLFHDGEIAGSLRELADLDDLLRDMARKPRFWSRLLRRSGELGLDRPLFYALRYTDRFLHTPIPPEAMDWMSAAQPPAPVRSLMDRLVAAAFRPLSPLLSERSRSIAPFLLYLRSHWLRMPPLLLARHLSRKTWIAAAGKLRR